MEAGVFEGTWTYRSFHNNPDVAAEFNALRFGVGLLRVRTPVFGSMEGTLGGEGWSLQLNGKCSYGEPYAIRFRGAGEIGGEPWVYDYQGFLVPVWTNGVNQRSAIVGTIVRVIPHSNGASVAGYVASWIAVKQE